MPFSRKHEAEADRIGLILMARPASIRAASVEVWANMARAAGGGPPECASTHPSHGTRIEALTGAMEEAMAARNEEQCPRGGCLTAAPCRAAASPCQEPRL
jgi:Zn-dependent protease with chaperone function